EEWLRFRVRLSPEDRATVDEALEIASRLMPGSKRPQQLEAMAQEYLAEHPMEAGDDGARAAGGAFRPDSDAVEQRQARLEVETDRWSFLAEALRVGAPESDQFEDMTSAAEIDARLENLAAFRRSWDGILGYCAYMVRRSGLWKIAGFTSFEHYCKERLRLGARTVEQRAALEKRLWEVPALRAARDAVLAYEKLRLLAPLPAQEMEPWIARAREMTCVELRAALGNRDEAQMRAARMLRARVPERVALVLQASFRAVRAVEGGLLDDGRCLVRVARHFIDTWKAHVKKARTVSQKVRERDLGRCRVPGCSRRAVHAHHVELRSRGGSDGPENRVALCAYHHLRGIHGGYIRVWGTAPDHLVWEVAGRIWKDGDFGRTAAARGAAE
ncbi:MAG TPA: HNH endonuclease signature motif containing protein, partial [Anaeromyxobacter sp.]|nr:HNH endonuclease signature motif containing protein [Anaeromyxobacter sp.]